MIASVAVSLIALAFASGGSSGVASGVGAFAVWVAIAALLLAPRSALPLTPVAAGVALVGALLAGWAALSMGWADNDAAAFLDLVRILLFLGAFVLIALLAGRGSGPSLLAAIALAGTVIALAALLSRALGFGDDLELARELPLAAERISYPLGYWNALGYLMAMTLVPLAWLTTRLVARGARWAGAASVPVVLVLFLTSSRGALVAALIGLAIVAWQSPERQRVRGAAAALVPAWMSVILLAAALRSELAAGAGVSAWGLTLCAITLLLATLAALSLGRGLRPPRQRRRAVLVAETVARGAGGEPRQARPGASLRLGLAAAVVIAAIVAIGPDALIGDFRTETVDGERGAAEALVSGSGRNSFWSAALEAFSEEPVRGIGAGGFEAYWTADPQILVPARNAHSAPLEVLAELGLIGGLMLLAFLLIPAAVAVRAMRTAEDELRGAIAAAFAVLLAGLFASSVDWTWEVPVALMPMVIASAAVCGVAFRARTTPAASLLVDPELAGYAETDASAALPHGLIRALLGAVATASILVAAVLAVGSDRLDRSAELLAAGDLSGAAQAARLTAELQPWSAEPQLTLAEIEDAAKNYEAARRRAERAAQLAPGDFRAWALLTTLHLKLGNDEAAAAYARRSIRRAPIGLIRPAPLPGGH